jgi:phage-related protein
MDQAALREFEAIPEEARSIFPFRTDDCRGRDKADIAKPMRGIGSGVLEIALSFRANAFRVVYAVQVGRDLWVLHAFQRKATQGIRTPQREIDVIKDRLSKRKEMLR